MLMLKKYLNRRAVAFTAIAAALLPVLTASAGTQLSPLTEKPVLHLHAAEHLSTAKDSQLLDATHAGKRIVAVGDYGTVLLSDDDGRTYRQARSVPVDSTLTSVTFSDAQNGWAVGHWGVIIHTVDGGETWSVQRTDASVDQPIFSVYFSSEKSGWAVGLWSLMLHTEDGGASWHVKNAPPPPGTKKADRNFYSIFADKKGAIYVTCEQGLVMRSMDGGETWTYAETGYKGSLWTGSGLESGAILVGGLRGTIYRSDDQGATWRQASTPYKASITGFAQDSNGKVTATSLDGIVLESDSDGERFSGRQRRDGASLTAVVESSSGRPLLFSTSGVVKE
jgi:photosystem II stability/assembly factor-like uncharacterized protein